MATPSRSPSRVPAASPAFLLIGQAAPRALAHLAAVAGGAANFATSTLAEWMTWTVPADEKNTAPVLLIAAAELTTEAWRFVRVRLAESGRFFVVLLPADSGTAAVVEALREGAYDAIREDEPRERWSTSLTSAASAEQLWAQLFGPPCAPPSDGLVGRSASLQSLREMIARVGPTSATVLVLGESGTGKERVAQALHAAQTAGGRERPFVAINCTALPRDLLEGELFGATKGAYTGALTDRPGLVEQAHGGTLFLDEIGDLDRALQPKLLRFLETRRARRLGARTDYEVNVRIVAATNAQLRARVADGQFREDLYYRLADFTLELSPLRERPEDIPLLCRHFLGTAAERHGKLVTSIEPALLERLQAWSWPGNIRELRSTIERLVILANGLVLREGAWTPPVAPAEVVAPTSAPVTTLTSPGATPLLGATDHPLNKRQKRELAFRLLDESGGDQSWVAARMGIHPTTLYRWCQQRDGARPE